YIYRLDSGTWRMYDTLPVYVTPGELAIGPKGQLIVCEYSGWRRIFEETDRHEWRELQLRGSGNNPDTMAIAATEQRLYVVRSIFGPTALAFTEDSDWVFPLPKFYNNLSSNTGSHDNTLLVVGD